MPAKLAEKLPALRPVAHPGCLAWLCFAGRVGQHSVFSGPGNANFDPGKMGFFERLTPALRNTCRNRVPDAQARINAPLLARRAPLIVPLALDNAAFLD